MGDSQALYGVESQAEGTAIVKLADMPEDDGLEVDRNPSGCVGKLEEQSESTIYKSAVCKDGSGCDLCTLFGLVGLVCFCNFIRSSLSSRDGVVFAAESMSHQYR